jgi:hypothetical protein
MRSKVANTNKKIKKRKIEFKEQKTNANNLQRDSNE